MYTVAVKRDFIAQHIIAGGLGGENQKHSHRYEVEVLLEGDCLDKQGYLYDIANLKIELDNVISHFRDLLLNELSEFHDANPSIEHFAHIIHGMLFSRVSNRHISATVVRIWEESGAWASYREEY